jgi:hypothetical protein
VTALAVGVAALELGLGGTVASIVGAGASFAMLGAGAVLETMPSRHQRVLVAVMVGWLFAAANRPLCPEPLRSNPLLIDTFVVWPGVLVALVVLADRADAMRPGSIIHGSRCRAVLAVVGLTLAILAAIAVAHRSSIRSPALGFVIGAGALASLAAAVVLDLRALRKIREASTLRSLAKVARVLDCGIGDDATEELVDINASSRDPARLVLLIRGSLPRAVAALRRAVVLHAVALGVAIVALGFGARGSFDRRHARSQVVRPCARPPLSAPALRLP